MAKFIINRGDVVFTHLTSKFIDRKKPMKNSRKGIVTEVFPAQFRAEVKMSNGTVFHVPFSAIVGREAVK